MNDACVIRRLLLPLSPKIENLWGPHIQNHAERTQEFLPHANGVSELLFVLCIALTPQSGNSSGAILEVPFKALLHLPHANGVSGP